VKPFKSVMIVKYPLDLVWLTIRDRLPELVPLLDDVKQITVLERVEQADGRVHMVNLWQAKPQLPAFLASEIKPEMMAWTDRADWQPASYECHWRIEPKFLPELTACSGLTSYQPAMGGRGTRITFEGALDLNARNLSSVPSLVGDTLLKGVEAFATSLIPKNFRKLTEAASRFLDEA
jgi:hypothetical protein